MGPKRLRHEWPCRAAEGVGAYQLSSLRPEICARSGRAVPAIPMSADVVQQRLLGSLATMMRLAYLLHRHPRQISAHHTGAEHGRSGGTLVVEHTARWPAGVRHVTLVRCRVCDVRRAAMSRPHSRQAARHGRCRPRPVPAPEGRGGVARTGTPAAARHDAGGGTELTGPLTQYRLLLIKSRRRSGSSPTSRTSQDATARGRGLAVLLRRLMDQRLWVTTSLPSCCWYVCPSGVPFINASPAAPSLRTWRNARADIPPTGAGIGEGHRVEI